MRGVPFLIKDMVTAWEGNPMTWSCPYFKDLVLPFRHGIDPPTPGVGTAAPGQHPLPGTRLEPVFGIGPVRRDAKPLEAWRVRRVDRVAAQPPQLRLE